MWESHINYPLFYSRLLFFVASVLLIWFYFYSIPFLLASISKTITICLNFSCFHFLLEVSCTCVCLRIYMCVCVRVFSILFHFQFHNCLLLLLVLCIQFAVCYFYRRQFHYIISLGSPLVFCCCRFLWISKCIQNGIRL